MKKVAFRKEAKEDIMAVATYSNVKNNFKFYCDMAIQDCDPIIVTNENSKNVVILSEDDFEALKETAFIASDENKMQRLRSSAQEIEDGGGEVFDNTVSMREALLNDL